MKEKNIKVIFDTNVWISFLIGKRLSFIKELIIDGQLTIIVTDQLLEEIKAVTSREKIKKYFPKESVKELISLLEIIAVNVRITPINFINRDPKDNFLLDLIEISRADYLITGDKDLLLHDPFKTAKILSPAKFEETMLNKL